MGTAPCYAPRSSALVPLPRLEDCLRYHIERGQLQQRAGILQQHRHENMRKKALPTHQQLHELGLVCVGGLLNVEGTHGGS